MQRRGGGGKRKFSSPGGREKNSACDVEKPIPTSSKGGGDGLYSTGRREESVYRLT